MSCESYGSIGFGVSSLTEGLKLHISLAKNEIKVATQVFTVCAGDGYGNIGFGVSSLMPGPFSA